MITGSKEALEDPDHPVVTIYKEEYAYKTLTFREKFTEGDAIFYQPPEPIKCGGAPKKILFLSQAGWFQKARLKNISLAMYSALEEMFPPCKKYSVALEKYRKLRNVPVHFEHLLKSIDKNTSTATFEDMNTKEQKQVKYDFLHFAPPQTAPEFIAKSPLANEDGWCDVDPGTLQHPKYPNIFSLGDASGAPTSKTAAAAFSQAPVVVHNIKKLSEGKSLNAKYDGYSSCPLFMGAKLLMLAEFDYDGKPMETFSKKQDSPWMSLYFMTKEMFPRVYFNLMPKGQWYGHHAIKKPKFD